MSFSNDNPECCWAEEARLEASTLGPADFERLRVHLSACDSCRREAAWDGGLVELLSSSVGQMAAPSSLAGVVLGRVRRQRLLRRAGGFLAAAALLFGFGLGAWQLIDRPDPPATVENPPSLPPAADDMRDVVRVAAERPVMPLWRIDRQQDAVLQVLRELEDES